MRSATKRTYWVFGVLGVLNVALLAWLWLRTGEAPHQLPEITKLGSAQKPIDLSGGAVVQRRRIDDFIASTSGMECDDIAASLNTYTEGYEVAQLAGIASPNPTVTMLQLVADRRVAKAYEILSSLEPSVAAERASKLFEDKLQRHVEETMLYQTGDKRQDRSFGTGVHYHAAAAALFLCVMFCDREVVMSHLEKWHESFPDEEGSCPGVMCSGLPDALFELNVLFVLQSREQGVTQQQLNERFDEVKSKFELHGDQFKLEEVRLYSWKAHTNDLDFTHVVRQVPSDDASIILALPGFRDWPFGNFYENAELQKSVFEHSRTWLR